MKIFTCSSLLLIVMLFFSGCKDKKDTFSHSPFHTKVSAFTSGQISVRSPIMVEFADAIKEVAPGVNAEKGIISIKPSIKGSTVWAGDRTLVFQPDEWLPSGTEYEVEVDLPRLFPNEEESFFFTFRTVPQNAWLSAEKIGPVSLETYNEYVATAKVSLADAAEDLLVESNVQVTFNGKSVVPNWTHVDGRNHILTVENLSRGTSAGILEIEVKKGPLSPENAQSLKLEIPARDSFTILSANMETAPRKGITVTFSDPVDPAQDISGLFRLGNRDLDWNIDVNRVELYSNESLEGEYTLKITEDVKNVDGKKLGMTGDFTFTFSSEKPAVELIGEGTIMPYSDGLYLPFKAVGLNAVSVRIIKIYEHNIGHFLQINYLGGESQLKRAGRLVHKQHIDISNDPTLDLNKWNTFSLDLSKFIQPDPGAIYRVELGFEQGDAIYPCAENADDDSGNEEISDPEEGFWDSTDNYYSTYPYHYNRNYSWYDRDNPCSPSYYTRDRWVARNVLASNLGLIVKHGTGEHFRVTVTDIRSAEPLSGVAVDFFNLQMVKIAEGETDKDGHADLLTDEVPFLMIARHDKQRGYLRMDEGQALALDRFDVSGETVRDGLKGFIFGERDVWRPGDSLFVSFMPLESQVGTLPASHPVTFELTDPRGRLIHRQTQTHPKNTLYTFRTVTQEDAPTGFWLARVTMGGVVFEKSLRIETIRPNRLKIELEIEDDLLKSGETTGFSIQSNWLHGSPASDLKADVRMNIRKSKTTFKDYQNYNFDDLTRDVDESEITINESILDKEGRASFRVKIPSFDRAPGKLKAVLNSRVFEEGGTFSVNSKTVDLSPFDVYTGIMAPSGDDRGLLLTDESHKIDVVTVDASGNTIGNQELAYTVYKINWRWWWEKSNENMGQYVSSSSRNIIDSGRITTSRDGTGNFDFRVNKPEWGRYLIRVVNLSSGHSTSTTVQVDWPGWARKSENGDGASHLVFSTDKSKYFVGDDISVTFPSTEHGRALVSLETGSRILKSWWVEPSSKETAFSFEATADMTPNIYISITVIQPYEQSENSRPLRLYGMVPVMVEDPETRLQPEIATSQTWRPDEKAEIKVGEAGDQPMDYVVAVVDEGLLDLTNHTTPDPWARFNAREALGVKTWDIYDEVIGAFGGKIEQLFSVGGDGSLSDDGSMNQMRRFEPMVRFMGPFSLKKGGENRHTLDIPSYTGSVRVMVIGSNGKAIGHSHTEVKIKKPLMVWTSLPKMMSPEERLSLPVTVFVTEDNIRNVSVSLEASKHYSIRGGSEQKVSFDGPGEKNVYFEIETKKLTGPSQITVKAVANGEESKLTTNLEVRMPNPMVTRTVSTILKGKSDDALEYTLPGIQGTNTLLLELSAIPPMDLTGRLNYLLTYPHGCIEQITSGGFPQLYIDKVVDLDETQKTKIRDNINSVLQRLGSYQTPDGGFAYWPGQSQTSDWGSSYAGHFMIEAGNKGYLVRPSLKSAWLSSQKRSAKAWLPRPETSAYNSEQMLQAYRLYTLALAGEPATSAMNRLRQQSGLIVQARWLLASAYALSGMHEVASKLMDDTDEMPDVNVQSETYGSSLRDQAILINALNLVNRRETAMPLIREAAEKLNTSEWYSTQTTAWTLMSIVNFVGTEEVDGTLNFTYSVNGKNKVIVGSDKPVSQTQLETGTENHGVISITNNTDNELFATLVMNGIPSGIDSTRFSENLKIETRFLGMNDSPLSSDEIEQGTDFKYIVRVSNPGTAGSAKNLALTQMVPSGWEIRNMRMEDSNTHERDLPDYRDIRDDRVLSYFDLGPGQSKEFVVVVHAAFPGEFYLPPVTCEAMYNYRIRARVPGKRTRVLVP